jgi:hypothetical protein
MKVIVHHLAKAAGFFSELFFMINSYIYSKKNNNKFKLITDNWMFKAKHGWCDYFENIDRFAIEKNDIINEYKFGNVEDKNIKIKEYKLAIKEMYIYNEKTKNIINQIKNNLNLIDNEYGSIFIRRGDKILHESKIYSTDLYVKLLLEKYPNCKIIFVQTDDYNCVENIKDYIKTLNLDITVLTICEPHMKGIFIDNNYFISTNIKKNIEYVNSIKSDVCKYKTVEQMNSYEIYKHTIDMIVGIDVLLNSRFCILDYQSNVSRFIKLAHNNIGNVFDIEGFDLDLEKEICPAFPESIYINPDKWRHV